MNTIRYKPSPTLVHCPRSHSFHCIQLPPVTTAQNQAWPINMCISTVVMTRVRNAIEHFHTFTGAFFLKRGSVSTALIFDRMVNFVLTRTVYTCTSESKWLHCVQQLGYFLACTCICDRARENRPVVAEIHFEILALTAPTEELGQNAFYAPWGRVGI